MTAVPMTILAMSLALVLGCSSGRDVDVVGKGWVGQTGADLEQVWGEPSERTDTAAGRTLVYASYWNRSPVETRICRQVFTLDAKDTIIAHA
ncbi:MAG TPA: hypothetical protein VFA38_05885, partial [Nitrospirales bacterium]|nr:hypothetical protein [Nitrospirales bacterium]